MFPPAPDTHDPAAEHEAFEGWLRLLASAVEHARDSILITDADLDEPGPRIVYANAAFTELTGYTLAEVFGKTPRILQGPETDRAVIDQLRDKLERGELSSGKTVNYRKDGTTFVMDWDIAAIKDGAGQITHWVATQRDVTEQLRVEQSLKRNAEQLKERNAELEQFAYIASHDLQEPLRMVSSFLQLLQRRYADQLDETADEYIAYAVDGAKRMQTLIRDLLVYSQVGTRGKAFKPVDMQRTLQTVLTDLGPALDEADATIEVADLPTVEADETQMRQLVQNLVANAIKFRGEAVPLVRVWAEEIEEGAMWRFAVADNGIGIASHHADRVFQIFQRLHTRDEYEGTGIGLAMCKKIVERHGGRLWFESDPDAAPGTTFYFTLPAASSDPAHG